MVFFVGLSLGWIVLFTVQVVANYFTGNGVNQAVIYHIKYGLDGAGFMEYRWLIITTSVVFILGCLLVLMIVRKGIVIQRPKKNIGMLSIIFLLLSLVSNPTSINLYDLYANTMLFSAAPAADVDEEMNYDTNLSFHDYYRTPYIEEVEKYHKNIVFIYAEGLERTYFDESIFPGLIKNLRDLESKSTYFTNIRQINGTGWTVAGISASQCGLPLFTPSHGNSMSGMDRFLSSAICLGDLLREKEYQLSYMGGADLDFAGKGKLFRGHGFTEVLGRENLLRSLKDETYKTSWGLYDDSLLDMVFLRFLELSSKGENFGLFTLTLDTHHPVGHPSKSCKEVKYKSGINPILNAIACSDYLIATFIKKIFDSPFADKTIVVLVSDHLAHRNTAYDLLKTKDRRNLFMILEANRFTPTEIDTVGSMLDIGTTILPFLGFSGKIGLGNNLLDDDLSEKDMLAIHYNVSRWSDSVLEFWDFPQVHDEIEINIDQESISIDGRVFRIPILVELDQKLKSTLRFELDKVRSHSSLVDSLKNIKEDKYFLLIDRCSNIAAIDKSLGASGFCLLAGQGRQHRKSKRLTENAVYTTKELRYILGFARSFVPHRVAHAGGGIDESTYTNSIEALNSSSEKGFKYFEIDFSFTKDDQLVCLHDWKGSFERAFGIKADGKVSLDEFNYLAENRSKYQLCTVYSLAAWMRENPDAFIVTDVKERNIEALKIFLEILPDSKTRVIPQVYYPENIQIVKNMGFEKIIWTLYKYKRSNAEVVNWVEQSPTNLAITMSKKRAESHLPSQLAKLKVPTYVHTINSSEDAVKYMDLFGISEIYTDFLPPP